MIVYIKNLKLQPVIGVYQWERAIRQNIMVSLTIHLTHENATHTDKLGDTVDYDALSKRIISEIEASKHQLIERIAEHAAAIVLEHPLAQKVEVIVDKPGAVKEAEMVSVGLVRERK